MQLVTLVHLISRTSHLYLILDLLFPHMERELSFLFYLINQQGTCDSLNFLCAFMHNVYCECLLRLIMTSLHFYAINTNAQTRHVRKIRLVDLFAVHAVIQIGPDRWKIHSSKSFLKRVNFTLRHVYHTF
jgi:hypothetical protein